MRLTTTRPGRFGAADDAAAIERSLRDGEAFMAVYERHAERIYRYMHRRFAPQLAQDLAAETFANAFASRAAYDLDRPDAAPWLFGIAANVASRHWRDESFRTAAHARLVGEFDTHAPGLESGAGGLDERTATALRELSLEQREALCLMAWGELSYEEIAAALDVPLGTVRSRIARARDAFREAIGASTQEEISTEGARR